MNYRKIEEEKYRLKLEEEKKDKIKEQMNLIKEMEEKRIIATKKEEIETQYKIKQQREAAEKQNNRYLDALHSKLYNRLKYQNIEIPAICACLSDGMKHNPLYHNVFTDCANNCKFYGNAQLYNQMLLLLLRSHNIKF